MIGVLIIDDSALVRRAFRHVLEADPEIGVLGAAADPIFAQRYMQRQWPDVFLLDLEMPRQSGLSFLREIMEERPTPVIVCSSGISVHTRDNVEALALGAFATVAKPRAGLESFLSVEGPKILDLIKAAHKGRRVIRRYAATKAIPVVSSRTIPGRYILIGASTGGVQALEVLLRCLPANCPPMVVVQHMPAGFTRSLAERLNQQCQMKVREAQAGDLLLKGQVLIAPGDRHLLVRKEPNGASVLIEDGPPVNGHRPAVDKLFQSAAASGLSPRVFGLILTGMGSDGAEGLLSLRRSGAKTAVQDEATSVVFGMPKAALDLGATDLRLAIGEVADAIQQFASGRIDLPR